MKTLKYIMVLMCLIGVGVLIYSDIIDNNRLFGLGGLLIMPMVIYMTWHELIKPLLDL